jgi:8-hydroxy-5-deazaflavin:NADPH oxidoreductase
MVATTHRIAVVGGTGPMGLGLANRFALADHDVVIGSRSAERAHEAATSLPGSTVGGTTNDDAVAAAELVVLAVPYEGHADLVRSLDLAGRMVVSCVNPLGFDSIGPYALRVPDGSAAEEAARLAPEARVVGAFHTVSAASLRRHEGPLDHEDVLVCGDDLAAVDVVAQLATAVTGRPGVICGPLRQARQLEPLTALLIAVNKRYKVRSGIRIGGL